MSPRSRKLALFASVLIAGVATLGALDLTDEQESGIDAILGG